MKHCILAKFKDKAVVTVDLVSDVTNLFNELLHLDGVNNIEVIRNVIDRPNRYDLLIRIDIEQDCLDVYDKSRVHNTWKEKYCPLLEAKAIFDYL